MPFFYAPANILQSNRKQSRAGRAKGWQRKGKEWKGYTIQIYIVISHVLDFSRYFKCCRPGVEHGKGWGGGKVSEQAALYAPRILKPIIWLNSFCNYPKGSALHSKCSTNNKQGEGQ